MAGQLDLKHPNVTVGFAMVDRSGSPFPNTVCDSERGAMIEGLFLIWQHTALARHTDARIKADFALHAGKDYRISTVAIESVIVVPDE